MRDSNAPTEATQLHAAHLFGTWREQAGFSPPEVVDTAGARYRTADGEEHLDFASQVVCTNLGFDAERVVEAMASVAESYPYVKPNYTVEERARLGAKLAEITPGSLSKTFLSTSGTEANEAAIKIARQYTGKRKILSRYRSYHGATHGALSASGDPRRLDAEPASPGMVRAPDPYAYGSALTPEQTLAYVDEQLMLEGDTVAAVLVEPVVGSNGVLVPPPEYLGRLKEIAHDHGALLICDEVMTGFGRTGEWFASQLFDVCPDVMTMAKGLTGAYAPLGATVVTDEVAARFEDTVLSHGHTYAGHPVSCAAGLAAIETYQREGLVDHAAEVGGYLADRLETLAGEHPSVGDVRGVGLFYGVELTRHPDERRPFAGRAAKTSPGRTVVDEVADECARHGVEIYPSMNTLILAPPLVVERPDVDEAIEALDRALAVSDERTVA